MTAAKMASAIGKGLLTANGAIVVRALIQGLDNLDGRLCRAYREIDPFGAETNKAPEPPDPFSTIPEVHLHEIVPEWPRFDLGSAHRHVDGALPWVDMFPLLTLALHRQPRCVFEIGTFYGYTARALALNLPNSVIHTLDLPESFDETQDEVEIPKDDFHLIRSRRVGEGFRADPTIRNVVQHFGDSATWDFAPVRNAELCFIDGSHTYEYVKNDTEKCLALCRGRRATILWHDVYRGQGGVVDYLAELVALGVPVKRIGWTHMAMLDIG